MLYSGPRGAWHLGRLGCFRPPTPGAALKPVSLGQAVRPCALREASRPSLGTLWPDGVGVTGGWQPRNEDQLLPGERGWPEPGALVEAW